MFIFYQLPLILPNCIANLPHRTQNGLLRLVGGQGLQPLLRGQLNIHTKAVCQETQLMHQLRRCAGNGFGMNVSVETIFLPQHAESGDLLFRGIVRRAQHAGGEEKTLNIIAPIELNGQLCQFPRRERSTGRIVGAAIDTIGTVVATGVAHQHFQKCDTSSVRGKAVTASCDGRGGIADHPRAGSTAHAAGCAGCVVLRRVG